MDLNFVILNWVTSYEVALSKQDDCSSIPIAYNGLTMLLRPMHKKFALGQKVRSDL